MVIIEGTRGEISWDSQGVWTVVLGDYVDEERVNREAFDASRNQYSDLARETAKERLIIRARQILAERVSVN